MNEGEGCRIHEAFEHLVSLLLITVIFGYSAQTISRINSLNIAQASEADMWRAQMCASVLEQYLSSAGGGLDPDKVASLSPTFERSGGPYELDYTYFLTERLGLPDVNLHLKMRTALQVTLKKLGEQQLQVSVTQSESRTPIQVLVKLYIFTDSVVNAYLGETSVSGYLNFEVTVPSGSVAIAFASSGSSVGYAVMRSGGTALSASQDRGYVKKKRLVNGPVDDKYIFAAEDWIPMQDDSVHVESFSLPILILWKEGNAYYFIAYPHLPEGYGAPLPMSIRREYRFAAVERVNNSSFVMELYVWRGGV